MPVEKDKIIEYDNRIIKAVRGEAEMVSTKRLTIPVRILACTKKREGNVTY
jgi:hypothetical protein